jgi:sulfoxide reductase heme-binding subunit YedZ
MGFLGFMAMAPLALTSTAGWIRRLGGRRWQMLHRLVYVSACAGVVHYYWLVKSDVRKPLLYGAIVLALLGERVFTSLRKPAARGVPGARVAVLK